MLNSPIAAPRSIEIGRPIEPQLIVMGGAGTSENVPNPAITKDGSIGDRAAFSPPPEDATALKLFGDARLALSGMFAELVAARAAREPLLGAIMESWLLSPGETARLSSDFGEIDALSDRAEDAAQTFLDMLDRLGASTAETIERLPPAMPVDAAQGGVLHR